MFHGVWMWQQMLITSIFVDTGYLTCKKILVSYSWLVLDSSRPATNLAWESNSRHLAVSTYLPFGMMQLTICGLEWTKRCLEKFWSLGVSQTHFREKTFWMTLEIILIQIEKKRQILCTLYWEKVHLNYQWCLEGIKLVLLLQFHDSWWEDCQLTLLKGHVEVTNSFQNRLHSCLSWWKVKWTIAFIDRTKTSWCNKLVL